MAFGTAPAQGLGHFLLVPWLLLCIRSAAGSLFFS